MSEGAEGAERLVQSEPEQSLVRLEESGARAFDPPAFDFIRVLLTRARQLEGEAREQLEGRAVARLRRLEEAFTGKRRAAERELSRLASLGLDPDASLARALEAGELGRVMRAARRHRDGAGGLRASQDAGRAALYRDSLADLSSSLSDARACDESSQQTGRLNGRMLAARILRAAETLSPSYRRTLVSSLIDLAPLLHLPPAPLPRKR